MKLCKDCKYFTPDTLEWQDPTYQIRYAICSKTSVIQPPHDGDKCFNLRHSILGCGKRARWFEPGD